jgi:hypothetical protein
MHCYRGLRSADAEARFSRSVLARENPFSRPIVAETEFVITLDGHFNYYLPGPLLLRVLGCLPRHGRGCMLGGQAFEKPQGRKPRAGSGTAVPRASAMGI